MNFQYNGALQRAHSYYGSEDIDPLDRPYRRHYSEDGSAEITRDMLTNTSSFVFYLGGDAYSASAIWKVVQDASTTDAQLYYLHRDYMGSILLITDATGTIVEQRQFDAWGNIVKLTDGSSVPLDKFVILDRGYTGHEHLFGVALIHMNGRLYDARLRRFLSPDNFVQDPSGTQGFNRYGYAMNSPLMYVDPGGEFFITAAIIYAALKGAAIGAAIGAVSYTASVAMSDGGFNNWNWGHFGASVGFGALNGALGSFASIDILSFGKGFGLSLAPQVSFGTDGFSMGANLNFGYKVGSFKAGLTAGANVNHSTITGETGMEYRLGGGVRYGSDQFNVGLSTMAYSSGETSQRTGMFSFTAWGVQVDYENDYMFLPGYGDGGDRFRTTGVRIGRGQYSVGINLFTGDPELDTDARRGNVYYTDDGQKWYKDEKSKKYRAGILYVGYGNHRVGVNSEQVRDVFQNRIAHGTLMKGTPYFNFISSKLSLRPYYRYGTTNPYSLW